MGEKESSVHRCKYKQHNVNSLNVLNDLKCKVRNKMSYLETRLRDYSLNFIGIMRVKPKNSNVCEAGFNLGNNFFSRNIDSKVGIGILLYMDKQKTAGVHGHQV